MLVLLQSQMLGSICVIRYELILSIKLFLDPKMCSFYQIYFHYDLVCKVN
jgi:hypothetical protein